MSKGINQKGAGPSPILLAAPHPPSSTGLIAVGNYRGAAGRGEPRQCFPRGEGRALNRPSGQLRPLPTQSELPMEPGLWPEGETPALAQGWLSRSGKAAASKPRTCLPQHPKPGSFASPRCPEPRGRLRDPSARGQRRLPPRSADLHRWHKSQRPAPSRGTWLRSLVRGLGA